MTETDGTSHSARILLVATKVSLAGIVGSVVLLGHTPSTQPAFYFVLALCSFVYILARGPALLRTVAEYVSSPTMGWRWAFLAWAVASLFWTARGGVAVDRAQTLIEIHALGLILFDATLHLRESRLIITTVFVSAGIGAAHALTQMGVGSGARLSGFFGNANVLALTAVTGLAAFHSGVSVGRSRLSRMMAHLLALALLGGVVVSGSRKGFIGVVAVWALGLVIRQTRRRVALQVSMAVGAGAALLLLLEPLRQHWERLLWRVEDVFYAAQSQAAYSASVIERGRFVREGVALFWQSPIMGEGLDAFRRLSDAGTYAHNNFVELGVSLGLVGLVLYYGFHAALLLRLRAGASFRGGVAAFLLIFVVVSALLDFGVVSYYMKLPALLLIALTGWVEGSRSREWFLVEHRVAPPVAPVDVG